MSDWLDLVLADELSPARAPEGLWGRVQAGLGQRPRRSGWRMLRFPVLAALAAMLAAGVVWSGRRSAGGLGELAGRELDRTAPLELRSGDPGEIGAWLKREAGVDVAIPASTRVRLNGARVIRERGTAIGEVAYRVRDRAAVLLVARAGGAFQAPFHHGGTSWQSGQTVYAIASSVADRQGACALCHVSL